MSCLQILFSKAIDLAEIISDKTFKINSIDKTNPRLDFNKVVNIKNIGAKNIGKILRVKIIDAMQNSLVGELNWNQKTSMVLQ